MNRHRSGILFALAAFMIWGFLPLYWKLLKEIPSGEIMAHRIIWCFIFTALIQIFTGRLSAVQVAVKNRKNILSVLLGAVFIGANWFIYVWAVNSEHIIDASMGYYINPLFSVFLGVVILKEKLSHWQKISITLAFGGVAVIAFQYGRIPWIALSLALFFGLYGLTKKVSEINSIVGLMAETFVLMFPSAIYLIHRHLQGEGVFGTGPVTATLLLVGTGFITVIPMLCFAEATKRIPLSTVGFTQYLSPSLNLLLGVLVYGEHFSLMHFVSFGLIWTGLLIYTLSEAGILKKPAPAGERETV